MQQHSNTRPPVPVVLVTTPSQYSALSRDVSASRVVAVDFETTGLDALTCVPLLLAIRGEQGPAYVVEVGLYAPWNVGSLGNLLADKVLLAHNAVFEYQFFRVYANQAEDVPLKWFCTQVAEGLIQSGLRANAEGEDKRVSLAEVYAKYCGVTMSKELQTSFVGVSPATFVPTEAQVAYAAQDVTHLHEVMGAQLRRLESEALMRVARLEMAVIPPLGEMMLNGFYLNLDRHQLVLEEYVQQEATQRAKVYDTLATLYRARRERENVERKALYDELTAYINAILPGGRKKKDTSAEVMERVEGLRKVRDGHKPVSTDFNLGSHQQVWGALAEAGIELYVKDWDDVQAAYVSRPSLDKNAVKQASEKPNAHPVLVEYAAWARAQKVISTYGAPLAAKVSARTGRVHAEYNQLINSGRMSSNHPNAQNMPKAIRACFEAEAGNVLISADGKNQEGRIAAALSGDPALLDIFRNDWDWHSMTAALAYPDKFTDWRQVDKESPERKGCKNANFSGIYGGVAETLVARGYVPDLATAQRLMDAKDRLTPRLKAWTLENAELALDRGYALTVSGRKRYFRLGPKPPYSKDSRPYARWKHLRGGIRRAAMNHPIQGSGADIMKQAMVFLRAPLGGPRLQAGVHGTRQPGV
jgi:DNA polymerase I-like protein with 3'-5' exonuclease and polymerase domains